MKVLDEKILKWKIVETKSGAKLIMIEEAPGHYWLEQNPLKESKYGMAYRQLKKLYPDLYLFWEFKDGKFTHRLKVEIITHKKTMDKIIEDLTGSRRFMDFAESDSPE